jgi:hypothetical protein
VRNSNYIAGTLSAWAIAASSIMANGGEARFTLPFVTGRPGTQPFAGHPGWVDAYHAGHGEGISARINDQAAFKLPSPKKNSPVALMVMFDQLEAPPLVIPNFDPQTAGDVPLPGLEYVCVPPGYPEVWDREYMVRGHDFYQMIVPRCTQLYGLSAFDGPKFAWWGNKINVSVHEDSPKGRLIMVTEAGEGPSEHVSATHSNHELPRIGWRHGNMPVTPGRTYAVRVDAFLRPDKADGYAGGNVSVDGKPMEADLCALIFGNGHGQLVENHIRSEEWELFVPYYRPSRCWGQSFLSHGTSLAGVSFWASSGQEEEPVRCEVVVHPEGPWEKPIGPRKVAVAHSSPLRPKIRYPQAPKKLTGYESFYQLPCELYQVAFQPDEVPLNPGKTYYIELIPSRPLMMYADGDYYADGHAYYERLKVDRAAGTYPYAFHSERWTLTMNIVTYAKPGGAPIAVANAE